MTISAVTANLEEPPSAAVAPLGVEEDAKPPASPAASNVIPLPTRIVRRFPISPAVQRFRRQFFPTATAAEWNDWRWQVRQRLRDLSGLERIFQLSASERAAMQQRQDHLPLGISPYYASLMSRTDPQEPLRRTHIPVLDEYLQGLGEADDPLSEDHDTVAPGLVHRYPDRVLFLTTPFCSTYCRYCTRSRMVGNTGEYSFGVSVWEQALRYLEAHTEVRDVLLSGGDPLALADDKLDWLLGRLRRIKHIEFVRIGTKIPVVLPQRITRELVRMLRKHHPLWMSLHFTHPAELTPEVTESCARLADAGIPLGSQTVLLKDINDDAAVMKQLMHGLLVRRVRPYYLYQCDPIKGSAHFRTPIAKGLEIIQALRGHTTGYAVPTYVVDAPGGGGKIPLLPEACVGREGGDWLLRNYEGRIYRYPEELPT